VLLVVGLGNPGRKYEGNRHNIGFGVVDAFARDVPSAEFREKFSGLFARGEAFGAPVGLLKPQTYMNESGRSVQAAQAFLKVQLGEILVVHDELDLPFGEVRLKLAGGHAGHNGLRDISARLGADYARLRVGIGRPPPGFRGEVADYVLSDFDAVERATVPDVLKKAKSAIERVARLGLGPAMNEVNQKAPQRTPPKPKPAKEPSKDPS
jgi:peptidyl-tRNA hydrolase, PTH1 family